MFYTFLKEIVVSQIPDDTLGKYLSNNSLLEPFWKSLDSIGNVEEGKQLLNSTLQNITQTIDKEDIEDKPYPIRPSISTCIPPTAFSKPICCGNLFGGWWTSQVMSKEGISESEHSINFKMTRCTTR